MQSDVEAFNLSLLAWPQTHDGLDHVKNNRGSDRRIDNRDGGTEELLTDGCTFAGRVDCRVGKQASQYGTDKAAD